MNDLLAGTTDQITVMDDTKDYLKDLIGLGGKFYDPDEKVALQKLARGKAEADLHISSVERNNAEMREDILRIREEMNATPKLQEVVDQLKQQLTISKEPPANEVKETALDMDLIDTRVTDRIKAYELEQRQLNNFNKVQAKLKEKLGDNFPNLLRQKRDSLGLTDEDVNTLAKKSPEAFFNTFGLNDQPGETFQTPPHSSRRSDSFAPQGAQKRTEQFYRKMRKENPTLYHNPKTQLQRDRDAVELGDAFFDGPNL